tara:strand:+ start:518 stop:835 length:318 start_codon:yes stop_codon:yes gene_type:complete
MTRSISKVGILALLFCAAGCSTTQTLDATHRIIRKGYRAARKGVIKGVNVTERAVRANGGRLTPSEVEDLVKARAALTKADMAIVEADKAVTQAWPAVEKVLRPK